MNKEEIKITIKLFLEEYHKSLFNIPLTKQQTEDIFNIIKVKPIIPFNIRKELN